MIQSTSCVQCGHQFLDDPDIIPRAACPDCGDTRRTFTVSSASSDSESSFAVAEVRRHIKHQADRQLDWDALLPVLPHDEYSTINRALTGDAPKDFVRLTDVGKKKVGCEELSSYNIAKVGSNKYPIESITEHLNTRLGQLLGVRMAHTSLCILAGQVRLLSNYFLKEDEALVHGIEILEKKFGEDYVRDVAENHSERSHYTFQTIVSAIEEFFPDSAGPLVADFIRMLTYDALIGLHDRHPTNWGIIRPIEGNAEPRFAPLFDNARSLFWNWDEARVVLALKNEPMMTSYVLQSQPVMRWEGVEKVNHFQLIESIAGDDAHKANITVVLQSFSVEKVQDLLSDEFSRLMSSARIEAILECLNRRHEYLKKVV